MAPASGLSSCSAHRTSLLFPLTLVLPLLAFRPVAVIGGLRWISLSDELLPSVSSVTAPRFRWEPPELLGSLRFLEVSNCATTRVLVSVGADSVGLGPTGDATAEDARSGSS
ncbi:nodulation-signaling pathway 1 protein [Iris pallida]|uniref:Nodulation-signaling pathway 1 protein n=1 Tax=Iris pallida TaxID=29817 RepID=A0AAX6ENI5_IRIPA|nr:nodulation-signaling pathway 1 protein [Iris pallida]KAJ6805518.1 nodulation-signaling pathway 1 protein [Iris pallida]KAJ6850803.1 nodulation-signaling pathway 1 protein [Iris pallida]